MSRVPKLPLIPTATGASTRNGSNPSSHGAPHPNPHSGALVVSSSGRARYVPDAPGSEAASQRTLTPRDLRSISQYIHANKRLQPQHRAGRLGDVIPAMPFQRIEDNGDEVVGLRLAKVNSNESALDIPLRLSVPADYHVPTINDLPMHAGGASSLASRIMTLLQGTSQVPQHSPEEKEGAERDVAHCGVIRDWEMRANVAKRAQQARPHAIALLALGSLHYKAMNKEKALRYFTDAVQAFEQSGDARGAALCHNLLGVACMHLGRHDEALIHHRKQGALSAHYGRCVAQLNIGVCYGVIGDSDSAVQALDDALRSATEAHDDVLTAIARGNLGIAYMRTGDLRQAQYHVEGCLEQCSVAGDKVGADICLLLLSDMYCQLGDYAHGQFYGEHALRVSTEARCTDIADAAKVTIGVARGAQAAQATVMETARRMGVTVSTQQVIATLPRH